MNLHINDANILIDIVHLDLVLPFLALEFELYTTDFVFAELEIEQQKVLSSAQLIKIAAEETEILAIFHLMEQHTGLSFEDCSVWYYAQKMEGILITGDGRLRTKARASGINVKGIIYIIEQIKVQQLVPLATCIEKMKLLKQLNNRLPVHEIENRIQLWEIELTN